MIVFTDWWYPLMFDFQFATSPVTVFEASSTDFTNISWSIPSSDSTVIMSFGFGFIFVVEQGAGPKAAGQRGWCYCKSLAAASVSFSFSESS